MPRIIYCEGEGYGFNAGVTEYYIITEDDDTPVEDFVAPGFEVGGVEVVNEVPPLLPTETQLIRKD